MSTTNVMADVRFLVATCPKCLAIKAKREVEG